MPSIIKEQDRENISAAELQQSLDQGNLILDDRRRRPLWFDGRFLDAQALNQQQDYYISKHQDVAQLLGSGVISGLMVTEDATAARTLLISEGRGVTPAGKLVVIEDDLEVRLDDMAQIQAMNLKFDLSQIPNDTLNNSSGVFVLGLRPVEYTSEPITSYPTEINGERSVEDSSVFEATAITIVPFADQGASTELQERRKHIASEIFVNGSKNGQPANILPLAMFALRKGVIEWLDPFLVRRMLNTKSHELLGLGVSPRILREAFYTQYRFQLKEVETLHQQNGFSAAEEFKYLPPAGPMPKACVNVDDFTQVYFPLGLDVELSIIPEDELYGMLEESFSLPPIDLSLTEEKAEATSIVILLAVPRHKIRALSVSLPSLIDPLKSVAADAIAGQTPIEVLTSLGLEEEDVAELEDAQSAWREAFQDSEASLWYTRRRSVNYKTEIVGEPVNLLRDETEVETEIQTRAQSLAILDRYNTVVNVSTLAAKSEVATLLAKAPRSNLVFRGAIRELEAVTESGSSSSDNTTTQPTPINRLNALKVKQRFAFNKMGEGISRLEAVTEGIEEERVANTLAGTRKIPELDSLANKLTESDLRVFSNQIVRTIRDNTDDQTENVARLIDEKIIETNALRRTRI